MVQVPVEIAFHNLPSIPWAEEEIRNRIARLEQIFDRLVTCRVRIDQRANNASGSIPPVVRIEMGVPGRGDLVVSHEPEHLQQKYRSPDLRNAIHEAFRIAEDKLATYKRQLQDRPKEAHGGASPASGQIAEIDASGQSGFILNSAGALLFFHRNSLVTGDFDGLSRGDEVVYVEEAGMTGPAASKVRLKSAS